MIKLLKTVITVVSLMILSWNLGIAQCPTTTYPLCQGESYTLTAATGLTDIQWQVDIGAGYGNIAGATNAVYIASAVGKYKYTAKDANNCAIELCCPVDIVVGTCNTVCPNYTYSMCSGDSYTLTAPTGLTNIQWQYDNGTGYTNIAGATNAVYIATQAGNYKYTAQDANNCALNLCCPVTIIVYANPATPSVAASQMNICPATTVNLSAISAALPHANGIYEWHVANDKTSALVSLPNSVGAGTYYLFAKLTGECYSAATPLQVQIQTCCPTPICIPVTVTRVN
jgi:hypothetical protein